MKFELSGPSNLVFADFSTLLHGNSMTFSDLHDLPGLFNWFQLVSLGAALRDRKLQKTPQRLKNS